MYSFCSARGRTVVSQDAARVSACLTTASRVLRASAEPELAVVIICGGGRWYGWVWVVGEWMGWCLGMEGLGWVLY